MKSIIKILLIISMSLFIISCETTQKSNRSVTIIVSQVGYLTSGPKFAYVQDIHTRRLEWRLIDVASNDPVYRSSDIEKLIFDNPADENVVQLNFTSYTEPGQYYIEVANMGRSVQFEIRHDMYNELFRVTARSYYFQRCGTSLDEPFAEGYVRDVCHGDDAFLYGGYDNGVIVKGESRDAAGGWHDAGDHGKKVTPAATSLYYLLKVIELFPEKIAPIDLNLPPDDFDMPGILNQAKYELDLFMKMQEEAGAVHHLITSPEFFYRDSPDKDEQDRYLVGVTSVATADFAAVMAIASKVYAPYSKSYAAECLRRAELAWSYLEANPDFFPEGGYKDPPGINFTGQYPDDDDRDERLWAASELFNATGRQQYATYFEKNYRQWSPTVSYPGSWQYAQTYGMFTYCFATEYEQFNDVRDEILDDIRNYADSTLRLMSQSGYNIPFIEEKNFYWASNMPLLMYGTDLLFASLLLKEESYEKAVLHCVDYILGANALNLSFVTGFGVYRVMDPHQSASPHDNIYEPIPGYVPGGPNYYPDQYDTALTNYKAENNLPPAKCYVDSRWAYSCNEVSVNMMAPLVFLAGYFYFME